MLRNFIQEEKKMIKGGNMKITAIPTIYNGVQFRSRLEATWAAFFDLLRIEWDYEPIEFEGWIPDFSITDQYGNIFYVEVKPAYSIEDFMKHKKVVFALKSDMKIILLGNNPFRVVDELWDVEDHGFIGWVNNQDYKDIDRLYILDSSLCEPKRYRLLTSYNEFFREEFGWPMNLIDIENHTIDYDEIMMYWKSAKNKSQWKRK
jgi:hypothetical protein